MSSSGNIVCVPCALRSWILAATVVAALVAGSASAQVRSLSSLERYAVGQDGTLRVEWDGTQSASGMQVRLPAGWRVLGAEVYSPSRGLEQATTRRRGGPHHVFVTSPRLSASCTVLVHFVAGAAAGRSVARVAPLETVNGQSVVIEADAIDQPASTVRAARRGLMRTNVGDFTGTGYLEIDRRSLRGVVSSSDVSGGAVKRGVASSDAVSRGAGASPASYTLALWMRTTRSDQVVLSDWTGVEQDAYRAELVVVADGTLAFYRGRDGAHQSMRADSPVSDGKWHHIAVTVDGTSGWSHLYVDGVVADSLVDASLAVGAFAAERESAENIALGDRLLSARADVRDSGDLTVVAGASDVAYTGFVDDVMLWSSALDQHHVLRLAYDEVSVEPDIRLDFEDASRTGTVPVTRVYRDVRDPMTSLRADVRGSLVELTWEVGNETDATFEVQQSSDGFSFHPLGTVRSDEGIDGTFTFSDQGTNGRVAYYRVAQRLAGGLTRMSPVLKIGLADVMEVPGETPAALVLNNFPNPFRESTSIHYELPADGHVQVSVWDLAGSPVATLVDETQSSGAYDISFSAGDLSAGTYFVRVQQGRYLKSHKLLLLK